MTTHDLKINQYYYDAVKNGIKTFEVRKADRDYKVGDTLCLTAVDYDGNNIEVCERGLGGYLTERILQTKVAVTYILTHDDFPEGVPKGYVVMSIKRCE